MDSYKRPPVCITSEYQCISDNSQTHRDHTTTNYTLNPCKGVLFDLHTELMIAPSLTTPWHTWTLPDSFNHNTTTEKTCKGHFLWPSHSFVVCTLLGHPMTHMNSPCNCSIHSFAWSSYIAAKQYVHSNSMMVCTYRSCTSTPMSPCRAHMHHCV